MLSFVVMLQRNPILPCIALLLLSACNESTTPSGGASTDGEADDASMPDGSVPALDGGRESDAGARTDSGPDQGTRTVTCDGTIVADQGGCLQDDAYCNPLPDGRYCTGGAASECPLGSQPIDKDTTCPERGRCWDYSEGLRCHSPSYTVEACIAAGGEALADPGDGSVVEEGCPDGRVALGSIDADWDEGGLCCAVAARCEPQWAHFTGGCEPAGMFFWNGAFCAMRTGCDCTGPDCSAGYATQETCEEDHASCGQQRCGGWHSGTDCAEDEYCAYLAEGLCGLTDASATCERMPTACPALSDPVCGCDGKSYANPCEAARADTGVGNWGECG